MPTIDEFMRQYGSSSQQKRYTTPQQQTTQPAPQPQQQQGITIDQFMQQYGGGLTPRNQQPQQQTVQQPVSQTPVSPQNAKLRQDYLNELRELEAQAPYVANEEQGVSNANRRRELTNALEALDAQEGNAGQYYDEASRAGGVLEGWLNRTGGSYLSALSTFGQLAEQQDETGKKITDSDYSGYLTDEMAIAQARQNVERGLEPESIGTFQTNKEMLEKADELLNRNEEIMSKVYNGANGADRLLADVTGGALDLFSDAVINQMLPGSGLAMMGVRSFGQGAYEQRKAGGTVGQQLLKGTTSAAIEVLTEKIGGPDIAYGDTLLGNALAPFFAKIGNRTAAKGLWLASQGIDEGVEEIMSDVLNPAVDRIFGLDGRSDKLFSRGKNWWEKAVNEIKDTYGEGWLANTLYDGAIGGLLGLSGASVEIAQKGDGVIGRPTAEQKEAIKEAGRQGAIAAVERDIAEAGVPAATGTPADVPAIKNKPATDSQTRLAGMLSQAKTEEDMAAIMFEVLGDPQLDAAFEDLTGLDTEQYARELFQRLQNGAEAQEGSEGVPVSPLDGKTVGGEPGEFNSENEAVEQSELDRASSFLYGMDDGSEEALKRRLEMLGPPTDSRSGVDALIGNMGNAQENSKKDKFSFKVSNKELTSENRRALADYTDLLRTARQQVMDNAENASRIQNGEDEWASVRPQVRADILNDLEQNDGGYYVSAGEVIKEKVNRTGEDLEAISDSERATVDEALKDIKRIKDEKAGKKTGEYRKTTTREDAPEYVGRKHQESIDESVAERIAKDRAREESERHQDNLEAQFPTPIYNKKLGMPNTDIHIKYVRKIMSSMPELAKFVKGEGPYKSISPADRYDMCRQMFPDAKWEFDGKTNTFTVGEKGSEERSWWDNYAGEAVKAIPATEQFYKPKKGETENAKLESDGAGEEENLRGSREASTERSKRALAKNPSVGIDKESISERTDRRNFEGLKSHEAGARKLQRLGFKVITNDGDTTSSVLNAIDLIRSIVPQCPVTVFSSKGLDMSRLTAEQKKILDYGGIFACHTKDGRSAGIFIDQDSLENTVRKSDKTGGISEENAVLHDVTHVLIDELGISPKNVVQKCLDNLKSGKDAGARALDAALEYTAKDRFGIEDYTTLTAEQQETVFNELVSDLFGAVNRAFVIPGTAKTNPFFYDFVRSVRNYFNDFEPNTEANTNEGKAGTRSFAEENHKPTRTDEIFGRMNEIEEEMYDLEMRDEAMADKWSGDYISEPDWYVQSDHYKALGKEYNKLQAELDELGKRESGHYGKASDASLRERRDRIESRLDEIDLLEEEYAYKHDRSTDAYRDEADRLNFELESIERELKSRSKEGRKARGDYLLGEKSAKKLARQAYEEDALKSRDMDMGGIDVDTDWKPTKVDDGAPPERDVYVPTEEEEAEASKMFSARQLEKQRVNDAYAEQRYSDKNGIDNAKQAAYEEKGKKKADDEAPKYSPEEDFGAERFKRLQEIGKKLTGVAGNSYVDKSGKEGFRINEGMAPFMPVVDAYNDMLAGKKTVREFVESYLTLNRDSQKGTGKYFYDKFLGKQFDAFADMYDNYNRFEDEDGKIREKYAETFENLADTLSKRIELKSKNRSERAEFEKPLNASDVEKTKKQLRSLFASYGRFQMRPDVVFETLAGFDKDNGSAYYKKAEQVQDSVRNYINTYENAEDYLKPLVNHKDFKAFSKGKLLIDNVIPNLKYKGGKISANMAVSFLKMLETKGAIDHIVRNGFVEMPTTEKKYYSGAEKNGYDSADNHGLLFDPVSEETRKAINNLTEVKFSKEVDREARKEAAKDLKKAEDKARAEMKALIATLHAEIDKVPVAKMAYDLSFAPINFLKKALNKTSRAIWGRDVAVQDKFYWSLEAGGTKEAGELLNDHSFGLNEQRIVQGRTGDRGGLKVRAFTDVMESYIQNAAHWAAFSELSDSLDLLARDDVSSQSLTETINALGGEGWTKWLENYMKDLNGERDVRNPGIHNMLGRLRSNVAMANLTINPGVALKQTPSGLNFAGLIDYDIAAKRFLTGALRSAKSFERDYLIQTMNQYTGVLKNRKSGYNSPEMGDFTKEGRNTFVGRMLSRLPKFMTNWINKMDYRTVANGLLACADQVKRNHKGEAGFSDTSPEFYKEVADLFEKAVLKTQPIYNQEYRAEYLRTDNELVRGLAMFRSQPTQNFNNLVEAYGENRAALRALEVAKLNVKAAESAVKSAKSDSDIKKAKANLEKAQQSLKAAEAEAKRAKKRAVNTTAGVVSAQVVFATIGAMMKLALHKKREYLDEDGDMDWSKFAKYTGLDFASSLLSTDWVMSKLAPLGIDLATDHNTYFGFEDGALGSVSDVFDATKSLVDAEEGKRIPAVKTFALSLASAFGAPAKNVYNILNAMFMWAADMTGQNPTNQDDATYMLNEYYNAKPNKRGKLAAQKALDMFSKGYDDMAWQILGSVGTDEEALNAMKKELASQFVAGRIDADQYRTILGRAFGMRGKAAEELVNAGTTKQGYNQAVDNVKSKMGSQADVVFDTLDSYDSDSDKSYSRRMDIILDLGLSNADTDALVAHYTGKLYQTDYNILREAGMSPERANNLIQRIDTNNNGKFSQSELWAMYQQNPNNEAYIEMLFNACGWDKTWQEYKAKKKK